MVALDSFIVPAFKPTVSEWLKESVALNNLDGLSVRKLSGLLGMARETIPKLLSQEGVIPQHARTLETFMNLERRFDLEFGTTLQWMEPPEKNIYLIKLSEQQSASHPALEGYTQIEFGQLLWRCFAYVMRTQKLSINEQCKYMMVPAVTMKKWYTGRRFVSKNHDTSVYLQRLEKYFRLPKGLLVDLVKLKHVESNNTHSINIISDRPSINQVRAGSRKWNVQEFSERNALFISFSNYLRKHDSSFYLRRFGKQPNENVWKEWLDYVLYKSDIVNPFLIKRKNRSLWKTVHPSENVNVKRFWYCYNIHTGNVAPTASRNFSCIDSFLSYCALPKQLPKLKWLNVYKPHKRLLTQVFTGEGIAFEDISLCLLADTELVKRFLQWLSIKTGNTVASRQFLQLARMYLDEEYGFFRHYPEFSASTENWLEACRTASEYFLNTLHSLEASATQRFSRNPKSKLESLLDSPNPFKHLKQLTKAIESERPAESATMDFAVWTRDRFLINLLITNPLRANTISQLTIFKNTIGDNQGMLRKVDGRWRLYIQKKFFKNLGGAAKDDYRADLSPKLNHILEEYLMQRNHLAGSESTYLFRPRRCSSWTFHAIDGTSTLITDSQTAMPNNAIYRIVRTNVQRALKVDVGTHGFRHLVATAWLKQNPDDYLTVAHILHDTLETVIKNYAHLSPDDGMRRYYDYLEKTEFYE